MNLAGRTMEYPRIVAEIGCNHKGELAVALDMIKVAAEFCKVDYVKFQKRNVKALLSEKEFYEPHPVPHNSYGSTYGYHREYLELDIDDHKELVKCCVENSVAYSCSVWDGQSAREIIGLDPHHIKVPSACNQDFEMLGILCKDYQGDIHISLGMTTAREFESIVDYVKNNSALGRTVFYACTSAYPVAFDHVCLLELIKIKDKLGGSVRGFGFSGHHLGIAVDIAALTLGASWIERHFTLDRTWKGTDHAASLEPDGLRRLVRDSRNVTEALRLKDSDILEVEKEHRQKLKTSI